MTYPGPSLALSAAELLLATLGFVALGELVRRGIAQFSSWARTLRPIERIVVDLYLGGAILFGIAALPLGLFRSYTPGVLLAGGVAVLCVVLVRSRVANRRSADWRTFLDDFQSAPVLIALAAALLLGLIELSTASTAPAGNTFDSSLLTFYIARLEAAHSIPLSFAPSTQFAVVYPQGTTVWLASIQSMFGLPPARTSLLATPLFLGMAPLGAYTVGDRLIGRPAAGATFAVVFAFIGSWTRVLVSGSNDFVLAFPLVLILIAIIGEWAKEGAPSWGNALFFGGLTGVAVTLNPAGPIWVFLTLAGVLLLKWNVRSFPAKLALSRFVGSLALGTAFAAQSLSEEVTGLGGLFHPGIPTGAVAAGAPASGLSVAQFVGLSDPFLFRATSVWLSPWAPLRDELAVLIVIGVLLLVLSSVRDELTELCQFARVALAGVAAGIGLLGAGVLAHAESSGLGRLIALTSLTETSILLFAIYTMVAAVPVYVLIDFAARGLASRWNRLTRMVSIRSGRYHRSHPTRVDLAAVALLAAGLLVVPGVAWTADGLSGYESGLYRAYGNLTAGDFALLSWAGAHLPYRARVLVAPGSAAEFLPGYVPSIIVLFPMVDGLLVNASYGVLVRELQNGTLDAAGSSALSSLSVEYIAITGQNTELDRPFSPDPFLGSRAFSLLFSQGDAYLFERTS